MANKLKSVIFDFDGVIASTFEMCRSLTKEFDGVALDAEAYKEFFDGNVLDNGTKRKFISFHDISVKMKFLVEYARRLHDEHLPVPGIKEVIAELAIRHDLHIVTSGDTKIISDFLKRHSLREHFGEVLGYDVAHSKVEKFAMLGASGNEARNYMYITDTLGDLKEAAKAGLPAIAVTWGFHDEKRLRRGDSLVIVRTPRELKQAIDEYHGA